MKGDRGHRGRRTTQVPVTEFNANQKLDLFKFYEEAAEKAKAHAWTQTGWILTLNAGVIAFSLDLFVNHASDPESLLVEIIAAVVGVVLCGFLYYVLNELGRHICKDWKFANQIAADFPLLVRLKETGDKQQAKMDGYQAKFPKFCRRLQALSGLFIFGHILWALFMIFR